MFLKKIENPYNFEKYSPKNSIPMIVWSWVQFFFTVFLLVYFYGNISKLGTPNMFIYGAFVFLVVFSYTELMDRNPYAFVWETLKNAVGFYIIYTMGGWFGINEWLPWATSVIATYFVISTLATAYFVWFDRLLQYID